MQHRTKTRIAVIEAAIANRAVRDADVCAVRDQAAASRARLLILRCAPYLKLCERALLAKADDNSPPDLAADLEAEADRELGEFLEQAGDAEVLAMFNGRNGNG